MQKRSVRRLLIGFATAAAVLTVLLVAVLALGMWYIRTARPTVEGEVTVPGVGAQVEVWRDSMGVPHLWARSVEDLLFAQGYVHAQDRLWQMELFRRVAEGRLAEAMGADLLATDQFFRTLGFWRAAGQAEARLEPRFRKLLGAYAAGVNTWINRHDGALPPEFVVLQIQPEPWTIRHTMAIEKIMAWDLAAYQTGLELARAVHRLGPERARILRPDWPEWGATILEPPPPPASKAGGRAGRTGKPLPPTVPPPAAALLDALSITRASNAWVIAGSRTRSGQPILANDMHLALRAPSLWHLVALHAGEGMPLAGLAGAGGDEPGGTADAAGERVDVVGLTIPGAPYVMAGHNRAIGWGFTNAMVDDADFFLERLDPADSTRYLTPDGSAPFDVIRDTIRVKGWDEPVVSSIRLTRHGPVLTPVEEATDGELIAFRWAAHDPSNTYRAVAAMNQAADWDEFVRALDDFDNPHQNVVYADTAGHIGYWMGGRVPIRGTGRRPPLLPVPGWTGEWDWTGELPFERHPHVLDPAQGYIVTANNRQTADAVADLISREWRQPFRAMRIRELILVGHRFDAADVQRQQLDVHDAMAERYRDRAVAAAERAGLPGASALLRAWDLDADASSRAAALFYTWYEELRSRAAERLYAVAGGATDSAAEPGWFPREAVHDLLERGTLPWVDKGGRSAFERLAAEAMRAAESTARGRTWGELHRVEMEHALGSVRALERALQLNVGPAPHGGSPYTVNVSQYGADFPVTADYGPSQRHVVDMGDIDGAGGFILPTGQSGLPFEDHYRDQFTPWRMGGLWRIPLDREAARARTVHRLVLQPAGG